MASPVNFNFPYFSPPPSHPSSPPPPPPHHPITPPHVPPPPPPHVYPRPAPLPPPPSPNNHTKKKKTVQEARVVHVDEHMKIKEAIVQGPDGPRTVLLEVEDDIHIDEVIAKTQRIEKGSNLHSCDQNHHKDIEAGGETSSCHHHQLQHKA
ncbi:hypothetical protein V6N13_054262 [Hibiscus sabdariffa]